MIEPNRGKPGESGGFGLGFAISKLDHERRIGHNGAVYGYATDVQALPDSQAGRRRDHDCRLCQWNRQPRRHGALRMMLAARKARPLPVLVNSQPISRDRAPALAGHYRDGDAVIDIVNRGGKVSLGPFAGMTVEIRSMADSLLVDDRLVSGPRLEEATVRSRSPVLAM